MAIVQLFYDHDRALVRQLSLSHFSSSICFILVLITKIIL
uniref:Uncharacterized protein n=1 Tax=Heterorhabditis bacteriophora TaxID=37862 RepID=A0A1I7X007_HETBA